MMWDLPLSISIDGKEYAIRDKCDYRVVLYVLRVINAPDLDDMGKVIRTLIIFYEDYDSITDAAEAYVQMVKVLNCGDSGTEPQQSSNSPKLMDWEQDFSLMCPPINHVLGYDVRDPNRYTHWFTFIGAFSEINNGQCYYSRILEIRSKIASGKKLDQQEINFYKANKKDIVLSDKITDADKEWLESGFDW